MCRIPGLAPVDPQARELEFIPSFAIQIPALVDLRPANWFSAHFVPSRAWSLSTPKPVGWSSFQFVQSEFFSGRPQIRGLEFTAFCLIPCLAPVDPQACGLEFATCCPQPEFCRGRPQARGLEFIAPCPIAHLIPVDPQARGRDVIPRPRARGLEFAARCSTSGLAPVDPQARGLELIPLCPIQSSALVDFKPADWSSLHGVSSRVKSQSTLKPEGVISLHYVASRFLLWSNSGTADWSALQFVPARV